VSRANDALDGNRRLWDAWTKVHETSAFYDLDGFRRGGVRLRDEEVAVIGDVRGRSLLHLQCHFGIDTLSWARLGARVTGVDFSAEAIALARRLADDLGVPDARFIQSDVYALPDVLGETFDVVYTSRGVLGWLPEIRRWAAVVARFVAPGGTFFIHEVHPLAQALETEGVAAGDIRLEYPYWEHDDPLTFPVEGSYADREADLGGEFVDSGWNHGLGEIVTALATEGLRIESLVESPYLEWPADFLVPDPERPERYRLPGDLHGRLPLMFALTATKPAD
jgi:SAM-dependent methyltransferase